MCVGEVLELGGRGVKGPDDVAEILGAHKPGDAIQAVVRLAPSRAGSRRRWGDRPGGVAAQ